MVLAMRTANNPNAVGASVTGASGGASSCVSMSSSHSPFSSSLHPGAALLEHLRFAFLVLPGIQRLDRRRVRPVLEPRELLLHDAPRVVAPEVHAVDELMRQPDGVVMAVRDRIVRMAEARERAARRPDHREDERPETVAPRMIARDLHAIALEGNLVVRLRHRLHARHGLGLRQRGKQTRRTQERHEDREADRGN